MLLCCKEGEHVTKNSTHCNQSTPVRGRGAVSNANGRYESIRTEALDDGWNIPTDEFCPKTRLQEDSSRSVLVYNQSPDLPFDRSVNPYRGCEHGCIYCFARPTHAYLGLSPGLDFETQLFSKPEAARLLEKTLREPGYSCKPLALGVNTDCYQPVERRLKITRSILEMLREFEHPVSIITKSALIERDIELLAGMAENEQLSVTISITTLDAKLSRAMEPRAAAPHRRLQTIRALSSAGIPVSVLVAPVIPVLTDPEIEPILKRVNDAGASSADYILLRLPLEIGDLFQEWLQAHFPLKAKHVMTRVRDTRGGRIYDSRFGYRKSGTGEFAEIISQRFSLACKKQGLRRRELSLNCDDFKIPVRSGDQISLF